MWLAVSVSSTKKRNNTPLILIRIVYVGNFPLNQISHAGYMNKKGVGSSERCDVILIGQSYYCVLVPILYKSDNYNAILTIALWLDNNIMLSKWHSMMILRYNWYFLNRFSFYFVHRLLHFIWNNWNVVICIFSTHSLFNAVN